MCAHTHTHTKPHTHTHSLFLTHVKLHAGHQTMIKEFLTVSKCVWFLGGRRTDQQIVGYQASSAHVRFVCVVYPCNCVLAVCPLALNGCLFQQRGMLWGQLMWGMQQRPVTVNTSLGGSTFKDNSYYC